MANNDGNGHGTDIHFPYTEVTDGTEVSPISAWQQQQLESQGDSAMVREVERRGLEAAAKIQRGESQRPEHQQAPRSNMEQSHQQTEQSNDTRSYAQGQEKTGLAALRQDQARTGQERGESKSLAVMQQDAQGKDNQRLRQGHTQQQAREQNQQQQKGQEKSHEQQKQQGR